MKNILDLSMKLANESNARVIWEALCEIAREAREDEPVGTPPRRCPMCGKPHNQDSCPVCRAAVRAQ